MESNTESRSGEISLAYSETTNLLEQSGYKYQLQDRETPNLYRYLFDYDSVPKISFNHRHVPINMPDEIWITDTTFRDGQQSTSPFTVEQIVTLFSLLHRLGGEKGLIRQSEFFVYSEKDREAVRECLALGYKFPEVTSWIRANKNDLQLVKDLGLQETGVLVSCSDYHIYKKMGLTRGQAMEKYLSSVEEVINCGLKPRCHLEDITRADFYGFVVPFVEALMKLGQKYNVPVKIRACDTMGYGVGYPGVALPRSVPGIIYGLQHYSGVPSSLLEWHGHNDFYKVVSNAATAWLYGCSSVNCALLGIGERTGNCPLEAMAIEYASLRGTDDGMDFTAITDIAHYFEENIGYEIPARTPFVGRSFNTTRAGIHADGLLKNEEIYNIFNTEKILKRPVSVAVDSHSGAAGIAHWLNGYYSLDGDERLDKHSDIINKLKDMVAAEYEGGRTTVMGDEELEEMFKSADFDMYERLTHIHIHRSKK